MVGLIPAVLAIGNGSWHTPETPMVRLLETQMPRDPALGDYRVLYLGDPAVIPVVSGEIADGIAYGVTDAGELDFTDRFLQPTSLADDALERALGLIADGSTLRAGRILAPLGIRYVVVPKTDGAVSTVDDPIPLPSGLVPALQNQLDLGSVYGPPTLEIFANQAWFPAGAQLAGATADASRLAGEESLARADLTRAVPSMVGSDLAAPTGVNEVAPGVVHLAVPYDERIRLSVDGVDVPSRPGFGVTTAFDVTQAGTGVLSYGDDANRALWRVAQTMLWLAVLVVAAGARSPFGRRRTVEVHDETLIDLSEPATGVIAGEALGAAVWDGLGWDGDGPDDRIVGDVSVESLTSSMDIGSIEPLDVAEPVELVAEIEAVAPVDVPEPLRRAGAALDEDGVAEEVEEVDLAALVAQADEFDPPTDEGRPT